MDVGGGTYITKKYNNNNYYRWSQNNDKECGESCCNKRIKLYGTQPTLHYVMFHAL